MRAAACLVHTVRETHLILPRTKLSSKTPRVSYATRCTGKGCVLCDGQKKKEKKGTKGKRHLVPGGGCLSRCSCPRCARSRTRWRMPQGSSSGSGTARCTPSTP
eukprot:2812033-Rhodomonas_salina.2